MVEWSREYYIDPATTGLNAVYRSTAADDVEFVAPGGARQGRAASVNLRPPPSESSKHCVCVYVVCWSDGLWCVP